MGLQCTHITIACTQLQQAALTYHYLLFLVTTIMATVSDHEGYYSGDIISGGEKTDLSEVSDFSDDDFTTGRKKFHMASNNTPSRLKFYTSSRGEQSKKINAASSRHTPWY